MKLIKKLSTILLALALVAGLIPATVASAASSSASSMKIDSIEGTVTVKNSKGITKKSSSGSRLFSGDIITTGENSSAYILLDKTKAVKIDENSEVKVESKSKKLELTVSSGSILFDVSKPLKKNETLNIKTSNLVCGVRGTIGVVSADKKNSSVYILEGKVLLTSKYIDKKDDFYVPAGEIAVVYTDKMQSGKNMYNSHVESRKLVEADIEPWVAGTIKNSKKLTKRVKKATKLNWNEIFAAQYNLSNRFDSVNFAEGMNGSSGELVDWDGSKKVMYFTFTDANASGGELFSNVKDIKIGKTLKDGQATISVSQDVDLGYGVVNLSYDNTTKMSENEEMRTAAQEMIDGIAVETEAIDNGRVLKVTLSSSQIASKPLLRDDSGLDGLGVQYIAAEYTVSFTLDFSNNAGDKASQLITLKTKVQT